MEILNNYINEKRDLQNLILQYLEEEQTDDENFHKIVEIINIQQNESYCKFLEVIQLIANISFNHHRTSTFLTKMYMIIEYLVNLLKKTNSNFEIYNIFKDDKLILLFLFEKNYIYFDHIIFSEMNQSYRQFFYPEIKQLIKNENFANDNIYQEELEKIKYFKEKRSIGENDSYICSLIRQDIIDEFVSFMTRTNISPSAKIKPSIFETNQFLIDKNPSLIEYSAFFGSIQIFNYLHFCKAEITSSLWLYSIHGQNAEIIHFLESNNVNPPKSSYLLCFEEAVKCHHNDIANYIMDNKINEIINQWKIALPYHNYSFFLSDFDYKSDFLWLCSNNYFDLVDILFKAEQFDIKGTIIIEKKYSFSDPIIKTCF